MEGRMEWNRPVGVFLLLVGSQSISVLGSRMSALAVGLWLFAERGAATPLALTALFAILPRLLLGGVAGVLADRRDRRQLMLAAEGIQALASLALLADLLAGSFAVWHLYLLAALQAAGGAVQEPTLQASLARLVPPAERTRANAILQLAGPLAAVLAPPLAALALGSLGVAGVVALDLLTFVVAAAALSAIRIPAVERLPPARPSFLAEAREGLGYLAGRRDLLGTLALLGLANAVFLGAYLLYPPYLLLRTGSQAAAGALLAIIPLGALVGGAAVGLVGRQLGYRGVLPALGLSGGALALVGLSRDPLALAVALAALAITPAFVHAPLAALIQSTVPEGLQGRVFAAQLILAQALTPLAYAGVGPLVDGWLGPLAGGGPGGAIGLLFVAGGSLVAGLSLAGWAHSVRRPTGPRA
jgi:DHA3 family macrolide efflux protein-like MFS transporter